MGYKVHKLTSLVGEKARKEGQETAQTNQAGPKTSSQAVQDLKLIDFEALTDAYRTIQGYSADKVRHYLTSHFASPSGLIQNDQDPTLPSTVKLDLNSLKN